MKVEFSAFPKAFSGNVAVFVAAEKQLLATAKTLDQGGALGRAAGASRFPGGKGQSLVVLGHFRRHGRLELLVVLGDGSKRLIPAEWTDHDQPETTAREGVCTAVPQTLGTTADLLVVCGLVSALLAREAGDGQQAARQSPSKEDFHAARTAQSAPTAGPCAGNTPDSDDSAARIRLDGALPRLCRDRRGGHPSGRPDAGQRRA